MDTSNPALSGLIRKRQEIAQALEIAQGHVRTLILDIDAVDATMRLFAPDLEIGAVRVKPLAQRHAAIQHESSRLILTVLRDAPGALSTREIVRAIIEARGMNTADKLMAEAMRLRLASSLLKLKRRGVSYETLSKRLAALGLHDSRVNLRNKVSRGKFTAAFLLAACEAMSIENIRLVETQ